MKNSDEGCVLSAQRIVLGVLACVATAVLCAGCVNCYTRFPTTEPKIERLYQCSRAAAGLSLIISFPQMMSDNATHGWMWENWITIPFLGLPCLCDAVCEGVIDTALLPVDVPIVYARDGFLKEAR